MVFARDDQGNQITTIYRADGTLDSRWVYNYDAHGKLTCGTWSDPDGALRLKIVKIYNADGKLIEDAMYNPDGSVRYKTLFSYDARGNRVKDTAYEGSGALANKTVWSRSGGNIVLYNKDGTIRYKAISKPATLEYDSHGNWIKWSTPKTETKGPASEELIEVLYRTYAYY
jgi:YD repeat-containing protein